MSKARVSAEEAATAEANFQLSKQVHAIVCHAAASLDLDPEDVYSQTAWPLSARLGCTAYEAFCLAGVEPARIFNEELTPHLAPALRAALLAQIGKRLQRSAAVKVRAHVECRCIGRGGVRAAWR